MDADKRLQACEGQSVEQQLETDASRFQFEPTGKAESVSHRLPFSVESPRLARALLRREMSDCDPGAVAAAELMVSELVTNAVVHAQTAIEIDIEHSEHRFRVVVTDQADGRPEVRHPRQSEDHGRGVLIVQSLASEWGCIERSLGKSVWFTVPCRLRR